MNGVSEEIKFCQRCGHGLAEKQVERRARPYCPDCGHVVFLDPKVAAVVLVSADGKLVMVRRGIEPALGRWSFPSGYVDRGEVVEDAAVREVREETGLDVTLGGFIGLYSGQGSVVILAVYAAKVVGGELEAGGEVTDAALFSPDELPPLPFPHDRQILRDWRRLLGRGGDASAERGGGA
jgi:ADP-ribose pyrophosphatase YjhB (NUDIX family)